MADIQFTDIRPPTGENRGFNIGAFRAWRNQQGILRNHDFIVEIPFPEILQRTPPHTEVERNLEFACDTTSFPTTALTTYKVARYSYGAMESKPTFPVFEDLTCTFIIDSYTMMWRFFHDWLRAIVNFDFAFNLTQSTINGVGIMDVYEISYKKDYAVDLYLYIYDQFGVNVRKIGFRDAYPVAVGGVPLSWAAGNQYVKLPVTFTFFDWHEMPLNAAALPSQGMGAPPIK